jgi:tetratricopeptide (TPR) repeat protein
MAHYEVGLLEGEERDRFEEHLLECDFCAGEVERMFAVARALGANREAIRRGLAEEGITFEALRGKLTRERLRSPGRGLIGPLREALRRPPVLWTVVATVTVAILLVVTFRWAVKPNESVSARRWAPFLSFQALPYEGSLTLRGGESVAGQEEFDRGMEAYLQADYGRAARHLRQAVRRSPDQAEWWLYLGVCAYLQRDAQQAIPSLGRADQLGQGRMRGRARWFLAQSYLLGGERDRAEPLLEWIVTQDQDYARDAAQLLNRLRSEEPTGVNG